VDHLANVGLVDAHAKGDRGGYYVDVVMEERRDILRRACPGAGACGGMYTANTMATAIEVLGMTLPTATQGHAGDAGQVCSVRQICIRGLRNGRVGPRACSARSSSAIHTVTLPRCRRLASYSGQFVVL
jgi:hypothetical protein